MPIAVARLGGNGRIAPGGPGAGQSRRALFGDMAGFCEWPVTITRRGSTTGRSPDKTIIRLSASCQRWAFGANDAAGGKSRMVWSCVCKNIRFGQPQVSWARVGQTIQNTLRELVDLRGSTSGSARRQFVQVQPSTQLADLRLVSFSSPQRWSCLLLGE